MPADRTLFFTFDFSVFYIGLFDNLTIILIAAVLFDARTVAVVVQ